jgi:hypothetical protein
MMKYIVASKYVQLNNVLNSCTSLQLVHYYTYLFVVYFFSFACKQFIRAYVNVSTAKGFHCQIKLRKTVL